MLQSLIQIKLVAMAAALGLNTADWISPSPDMVKQVEALEKAMTLINEGKSEQVQGQVQDAVNKIKELADKTPTGDKDAQFSIGLLSQNQQGGLPQAMEYYTKAAAQGQLQAMNNLGFLTMAQANQLPEKDRDAKVAQGVGMIEDAARKGNNPARRNMAQLYLTGQAGVKQNVETAHSLLETAAKDKDDQAEFELFQYFSGSSGKNDDAKAKEWLEKSATDGNPSGLDTLGSLYLQGGFIGKIEYKKDEEAALKKFQELAVKKNPVGLRKMGGVYEAGLGSVKKDYQKAVESYQAAAQGNDALAQFRLASMLDTGWTPEGEKAAVVPRNDAAALNLYKLAQQNKFPIAGYNVGVFYEQGRSVDKDLTKAFSYFMAAAQEGVALAMQKVGVYYTNGAGTTKDPVAAAAWFDRAGASGLADGSLAKGVLIEGGAGPISNKGDNPYLKAHEAYNEVVSNPNASDNVLAEALLRMGSLFFRGVTNMKDRVPQPEYKKAYIFFKQAADVSKNADLAVKLLDAAKKQLKPEDIKQGDEIAGKQTTERAEAKKNAAAGGTPAAATAPAATPVQETPAAPTAPATPAAAPKAGKKKTP